MIKQVSVFMENRKGRLEKVTAILKDNDINIASISLADTSEYGLLRLIVSDPDKAQKVLKENGFSAMLTEVTAVRIPHRNGKLSELLKLLREADLNVEYMYALSTEKDRGAMIMKTSDIPKGEETLKAGGMEVMEEDEAYALNI